MEVVVILFAIIVNLLLFLREILGLYIINRENNEWRINEQ